MNNMVISTKDANDAVEKFLVKIIDIVDPKIVTKQENNVINHYAIDILEQKDNKRKTRILYINHKTYLALLGGALRKLGFRVTNVNDIIKDNEIYYSVDYKKVSGMGRK